MRTPQALRVFLLQAAFWMALCLGSEVLLRYALHWGYPYGYPFPPAQAMLGDFRSYMEKFAFFHSRAFFAGPILTYPAPAASLFALFLPGRHGAAFHPVWRYVGTILLASWVMLGTFYRMLRRHGLARRAALGICAGLYLTSYPFWFELHQGNIEFVVWIVLTLGIWAHCTRRSYLAAACFGVAGALKLFPLLFVGLLLARRQLRETAIAALVAAACTVLGLWLLCPDLAYSWRETQRAMASLSPDPILMLPPLVSGFDHSLWVLGKRLMPHLPDPAHLQGGLRIYLLVSAAAGLLLFVARIRKLPTANQVLCLTVACILLPPVSYDYTLIHLYAPFALVLVVLLSGQDRSRAMRATLTLFAFVLSWQSEFIWHGVRFGGQTKAVALLLLFCVALVHPFPLPGEAAAGQGAELREAEATA